MRWRPYVPVHKRKAQGLARAQKAIGKGKTLQPIQIEGRKIAKTFWGSSWCTHLERFSDFSNRLPRGRTYARNGSIVHLEISTGKITAMVAGSDLYKIKIKIDKMSPKAWKKLCAQCASSVSSTIDLLRGKLPEPVLKTLTNSKNDLFPRRSEIRLDCDCPDWADLCKHLAAVLYGVGNRLDDSPELLFKLRGVDANDLIGTALVEATDVSTDLPDTPQLGTASELEEMFGIDLIDESDNTTANDSAVARTAKKKKKKAAKKSVTNSAKKKAPKKKAASKKKVTKKKSKESATAKPVKKQAKKKTVRTKTARKKTAKKKPSNRKKATASIKKKATKKKSQSRKSVVKEKAKKKAVQRRTTTN